MPNPKNHPEPDPRLGRPYTRSERQREASRRNIRLAQRVACRLMKTPGYQPSPQRQDANHANLVRANEVRLHSPRYPSCFRDGLSAASLERSLVMAGEKLEEYRAHLEWFRRVFTQGIDEWANAAGIRKLATALGQASWRRLRVFRTLPEWELLAVCHSLRGLAAARRRGEELSEARLAYWARELQVCALEGGRLWASKKAQALDNRVEALACQLLLERGEEGFHRRARLSPVVLNFERWTAEALGNPLMSPQRVVEALREHRVEIADLKDWRPFGSGRSAVFSLRTAAGLDLLGCESRLLPRGRKQEAEGQPSAPRCFEDFLKLVNEALGEGQGSEIGGQGSAAGIGSRESAVGAKSNGDNSELRNSEPRTDRQSSIDNRQCLSPQSPTPECDPELRELAEALWERLQFFRQQGEKESAEVQAMLGGYEAALKDERCATCSLQHEEAAGPDPALPPGTLARKLVDRLMQGEQAFRRVQGPEHRVKQALYTLLVKRYGEQPEFRELKPRPPDVTNLLVQAMLLNAMGRKAEAEMLLNLADGIDARARGQPPPGG